MGSDLYMNPPRPVYEQRPVRSMVELYELTRDLVEERREFKVRYSGDPDVLAIVDVHTGQWV